MEQVLSVINNVLTEKIGIPYEFGEWTSELSYPYYVGNYSEDDFSYEDNHTHGVFTIDGWSRGEVSKLDLITAKTQIKEIFSNYITTLASDFDSSAVDDDKIKPSDVTIWIRYITSDAIPTGDDLDLYRITIRLSVDEWKGENNL